MPIDLDELTEAEEAWLLEHSEPVVPVGYSATGRSDPDDITDEAWHDWLATRDWSRP